MTFFNCYVSVTHRDDSRKFYAMVCDANHSDDARAFAERAVTLSVNLSPDDIVTIEVGEREERATTPIPSSS